MHQTKNGKQWYFGMKGHFGIDSRRKLIHADGDARQFADGAVLPDLLHGRETRGWGDQAYRGQQAIIKRNAPGARDFTNRRYRHRGVVDETERAKNRTKSKVHEHPIGVIKQVFGFVKVRYRGLAKNPQRLRWPICLSRAGIYCAASRRNAPRACAAELINARAIRNGASRQTRCCPRISRD
jgi:IS5 family transposase